MTAQECIRGRRSIRKFKAEPVNHDLLNEIIETASYAPSWKHSQIARYIAVEGALKDTIARECTQMFPGNGAIMENAPMLVALTFIKGRSGYERDGSFTTKKGASWQMFDAGIAAEAFCLAAYEKGLGSVIMGIFDEDKAASLLELPDSQELAALIPVGYPDEEPICPRRKPVADLLTYK
jgi:nitroreductase